MEQLIEAGASPRRRCRQLKATDVTQLEKATDMRTPTGELLPLLYNLDDNDQFKPTDPTTILQSAAALLACKFRRGAKIFRDPALLRQFLQTTLVAKPYPIFAAFFLDPQQRLIRFSQLFRGSGRDVFVKPREILREALSNCAERVLCVRSDPLGDHTPTVHDINDAQIVCRALKECDIELMDYLIVGEEITSLRETRRFWPLGV